MIRWQSWMQYLATTLQYHVIIVAYYRNFVDYSLSRFSQRLKKCWNGLPCRCRYHRTTRRPTTSTRRHYQQQLLLQP